jgi:hypothetical protein
MEIFKHLDLTCLAQLVERQTLNLLVVGSNPTIGKQFLKYNLSLNKF